jgi:hypothetical protein
MSKIIVLSILAGVAAIPLLAVATRGLASEAQPSALDASDADKAAYEKAATYRKEVNASILDKLKHLTEETDPPNKKQRQVFKSWMLVDGDSPNFASAVDKVLGVLTSAQSADPVVVLPPESLPTCEKFDAAEREKNPAHGQAYAWHSDHTVYFCAGWATASDECKRVVLFHEFLHESGLVDNKITSSSSVDERVKSASWMAGLATQLYSEADISDNCGGKVDSTLPDVNF